ncbi:hypothetical protein [Streptococcus sp. S784/96/1]|uniref:hypothetical protein n=1 Tax=Streptococcus sp. S784/96/1 TaxID=2653499 RepID=UPI0013870785|nr:hypothetical protein [Streptococcus sp. S784/96/1]
MLGNYTIMDLVTLGGVLTAVGTVLGGASAILTILRDNKSIKKELGVLSQNQKELSQNQNELSNRLFVVSGNVDKLSSSVLSKTESLSDKSVSIKVDTTYISDEMKLEKMARESLYKNSSRAKEILETMDMMREVVLKNAELTRQINDLQVEYQQLTLQQESDNNDKLVRAISSFERQLAEFDHYRESEEIQSMLKRIGRDLSEIEE